MDFSAHKNFTLKDDPIALLVDGENLSSDFAEAVLAIAKDYGVPTVRRVYGKLPQIAGWADQGFRLVPTRAGKNAADLLLSVEAVILALREQFHTLVIAASDSDYAYLAEHLRELGHEIIGIGEPQALPGYRATCSVFVELLRAQRTAVVAETAVVPAGTAQVGPAKQPVETAAKATPLNALERRLKKLLMTNKALNLVGLGNAMKGETVRLQTGCATWRSYLLTRKDLYRIDGAAVASVVVWVGP